MDILIADKAGSYYSTMYSSYDEARAHNDGVHQAVKVKMQDSNNMPTTGWMNWNPRGYQKRDRNNT